MACSFLFMTPGRGDSQSQFLFPHVPALWRTLLSLHQCPTHRSLDPMSLGADSIRILPSQCTVAGYVSCDHDRHPHRVPISRSTVLPPRWSAQSSSRRCCSVRSLSAECDHLVGDAFAPASRSPFRYASATAAAPSGNTIVASLRGHVDVGTVGHPDGWKSCSPCSSCSTPSAPSSL